MLARVVGREVSQRVFPHASTLRFYLQVGSVLTGVQALDARSWNAPNHLCSASSWPAFSTIDCICG
jgi:hypothetical protein